MILQEVCDLAYMGHPVDIFVANTNRCEVYLVHVINGSSVVYGEHVDDDYSDEITDWPVNLSLKIRSISTFVDDELGHCLYVCTDGED